VQPLAAALNSHPIDLCDKEDVGELVDAVLDSEPVVVICWEQSAWSRGYSDSLGPSR